MFRMKALNSKRSNEESDEVLRPKEPSKEELEKAALTSYNTALLLQKQLKFEESINVYNGVLHLPIIEQAETVDNPSKTQPGGLSPIYGKTALTLKYLCYKNLAEIHYSIDQLDESLNCYYNALNVDATDVMVLYQTGTVAAKVGSIRYALNCYLRGLEQSPKFWLCLDKACICLYVLGDYVSIMMLLASRFEKDANYPRGLILRDLILQYQPSIRKDIATICPDLKFHYDQKYEGPEKLKEDLMNEIEAVREWQRKANLKNVKEEPNKLSLSKPLSKLTWVAVGESLLHTHNLFFSSETEMSVITDVDLLENLPENIVKVDPIEANNGEVREAEEIEKEEVNQDKAATEEETEVVQTEKKGKKRSGAALLEELWWSKKRRSARVRTNRKEQESLCVADALKNILPRKLLHRMKPYPRVETKSIDDDSMDTMDLYKLFAKQDGGDGQQGDDMDPNEVELDRDKIVREEGYFNTVQEESDVRQFLETNNKCLLFEITQRFVLYLAKFWNKLWPKSLPGLYVECHKIMRLYFPVLMVFDDPPIPHPAVVNCEADLLFHELVVDSAESSLEDVLTIMNMTELDEACDYREQFPSPEAFAVFDARLKWMKAHYYMTYTESFQVLYYLTSTLECFEDCGLLQGKTIRLSNCRRNKEISKESAQAAVDARSRERSLAEVIKLYEEGSYEKLAEILRETFKNISSMRSSGSTGQLGEELDQQTQLSMLINALGNLNEFKECIYWLETSCYELMTRVRATDKCDAEEESQEWKIDFDRHLVVIETCCEKAQVEITDALPFPRLSRFVQTLCHAICRQSEDIERPPCASRPWIILNRILVAMEKSGELSNEIVASREDDDDEIDIPSSVLVLFTAHEYLGRREWCNCDGNVLLFLIMDQVIPRLRCAEWAHFRETVQQHVEQVVFCLYGHPNKKAKARYLTEHNVSAIPLTWERAMQLFQLFRPDEMPFFDSLRINLISSETEVLFRRIAALIPDDIDPAKSCDAMRDFIFGRTTDLPSVVIKLPESVKDLFYVLGDYYLKSHECGKAVTYLLMDICSNPLRVDSWASLALSKGAVLELKLNSCDPIKNDEFLEDSMATIRCYEHCLSLDDSLSALWIEYGNFSYTIHAFCSQRMKLESDSLDLEQFEQMEETKTRMLEKAKSAFVHANNLWNKGEDTERQDERWLHHYMLGKVCEKYGDLSYLDHYEKAANLLYENNAQYPRKIGYKAPQTYAIESLEVFYRVHVCVIKWLELHDDESLDENTRTAFLKALKSCAESPFALQMSKADLLKQKAKEEEELELEKLMLSEMIDGILDEIIELVTEEKNEIKEIPNDTAKNNKNTYSAEEIKTEDLEENTEQDKIHTSVEETKTEENLIRSSTEESVIGESDGKLEDTDDKKMSPVSDVEMADSDGGAELIKLAESAAKDLLENDPDEAAKQFQPKPPASEPLSDDFMKDFVPCEPTDDINTDAYSSQCEEEPPEENYYLTLDDFKQKPSRKRKNDDFYLTLDDFKESNPRKGKKRRKRTLSEGSTASSESSEIKYDDDSSSSSSTPSIVTSRSRTQSSSSDSDERKSKKKEEKVIPAEAEDDVKDEEIKKVVSPEKPTEAEPEEEAIEPETFMLRHCLKAFETCALRFPQHYKSVYRLAHFYYRSKTHKDLSKCRELLLGIYPTESGKISGLFAEKKNTNFFNGIWRLPAGDVDRPGSFISHMSRSVLLLLEVLRDLRDYKLLLELCLQLRKVPEPDKRYLREDERVQLSKQALTISLQILKLQLKQSENITLCLVLDVYRLYRKVQKHYPAKETVLSEYLMDGFRRFVNSDSYSLDHCLKYCQGELTGNKYTLPEPKKSVNENTVVKKVRKNARDDTKLKKKQKISKILEDKKEVAITEPIRLPSTPADIECKTDEKEFSTPEDVPPLERADSPPSGTSPVTTTLTEKPVISNESTNDIPVIKETVVSKEVVPVVSEVKREKEAFSMKASAPPQNQAQLQPGPSQAHLLSQQSPTQLQPKPLEPPLQPKVPLAAQQAQPLQAPPQPKPPLAAHQAQAPQPPLQPSIPPSNSFSMPPTSSAYFSSDAFYTQIVSQYLAEMQKPRKKGRPPKYRSPLASLPHPAHLQQLLGSSVYGASSSTSTYTNPLLPSSFSQTHKANSQPQSQPKPPSVPSPSKSSSVIQHPSQNLASSILAPKAVSSYPQQSNTHLQQQSHKLPPTISPSKTMSSYQHAPRLPDQKHQPKPTHQPSSSSLASLSSVISQQKMFTHSYGTPKDIASIHKSTSLLPHMGPTHSHTSTTKQPSLQQAAPSIHHQSNLPPKLPASISITPVPQHPQHTKLPPVSTLLPPKPKTIPPFPSLPSNLLPKPPVIMSPPAKAHHTSVIASHHSPPIRASTSPRLLSPESKTKFNIDDILGNNSEIRITRIPSGAETSIEQTEAMNLSPDRKKMPEGRSPGSNRAEVIKKGPSFVEKPDEHGARSMDAEIILLSD